MLKRKEIRKAIGFTILMALVYCLGVNLTLPGIEVGNISSNGIFATLSLLSGGALEQMSLFSLGIGPYITAGIVVQLLSMDVIPALSEWKSEGNKGRKKTEKVTKYLTLILAVIQAVALTYSFDKQYMILASNRISDYLFIATLMTAGSMLLLYIAGCISKYGIGNGTSLIIFAGIVNGLPTTFRETWNILVGQEALKNFAGLLKFSGFVLVYLLILTAVVFIETAQRKIPVQAINKTVRGMNQNNLPFKLNNAGVIPVIFAQAIITTPQVILSLFNYEWYTKVSNLLDLRKPFGLTLYAALILAFAFFYTHLQTDAKQVDEQLRKSNQFIPGIRAGKETVNYINKSLNRLTLVGGLLLVLLAVLPYILIMTTNLSTVSALGGTSFILLVGIALETMKELQTAATDYKYAGLIK